MFTFLPLNGEYELKINATRYTSLNKCFFQLDYDLIKTIAVKYLPINIEFNCHIHSRKMDVSFWKRPSGNIDIDVFINFGEMNSKKKKGTLRYIEIYEKELLRMNLFSIIKINRYITSHSCILNYKLTLINVTEVKNIFDEVWKIHDRIEGTIRKQLIYINGSTFPSVF